jgi:hypothetical protein
MMMMMITPCVGMSVYKLRCFVSIWHWKVFISCKNGVFLYVKFRFSGVSAYSKNTSDSTLIALCKKLLQSTNES